MIVFIYGTTAEAIKLAPVARRLKQRGIPFEQWLTMQHTDALLEILPQLGLPAPDRLIANGHKGQPLRGSRDVLGWLLQASRWLRGNRAELRRTLPANTVIVVHGDTITSVIGAYFAKRLKVACAHIEAGLRSGNWRHPFPEEIDRRLVGRLATVHYTPSEEATENLAGKDNVVFTHGNTIVDAVLDHDETEKAEGEKYGVVLLHRYEFISNQPLVDETIGTLNSSSPYPLKMLVDAYNSHTLGEATGEAESAGRIVIESKRPHDEFITLLKSAEFIVTDSGGVQAEAALLGVPTLVHRMATEQQEGVGENILLSKWNQKVLSDFLTSHADYRVVSRKPHTSPSDIIVDDLIARGYATS
ncbi:UDP-N-acetylglucosamine 2-epimerase [Leifsonia sp. NPDC058230]|uniref:UDP-N-acetylglucosamine 2-epimerase n=1 Tax=Leifsonia sp. NPDC058230 TaxID=3346391 RepID=UPI0036DAB19E